MSFKTLFLAHAEADHAFACELAAFLELGCNVNCSPGEGRLRSNQDLLSKAEEGLSCDVLALVLSPASCSSRWARERWEPVLFEQTAESGVELVTILLRECPFPPLLSRRNFFDATRDRRTAMRLIKRWLWQREHGMTHSLNLAFSSDLEDLYSTLSDEAGTLRTSGAEASRFSKEAGQEFDGVFWVSCHGRSLAQITGELAAQLGMTLDGTTEQNCRSIQDLLYRRRCLLILDAPEMEIAAALIPHGRTSTLVTTEPVSVVQTPESVAYARKLVSSGRYAEAYELFYRLLGAEESTADCARELSWICDHWNRAEESESLRYHFHVPPTDQLSLF